MLNLRIYINIGILYRPRRPHRCLPNCPPDTSITFIEAFERLRRVALAELTLLLLVPARHTSLCVAFATVMDGKARLTALNQVTP